MELFFKLGLTSDLYQKIKPEIRNHVALVAKTKAGA